MAGIIKVDRVQSDSNLAFNIAGANVAFMNAASLQLVGSNVSVNGTNVIQSGKVTAGSIQSGGILQMFRATPSPIGAICYAHNPYNSGAGLTVTTDNTTSLWTQAITPTVVGSKIYVIYQSQEDANDISAYKVHTCFIGGTFVGGSYRYPRNSGSEPFAQTYTTKAYTTTSLNPLTIDFRYGNSSGGYILLNRFYYSSTWTGDKVIDVGTSAMIYEVAP